MKVRIQPGTEEKRNGFIPAFEQPGKYEELIRDGMNMDVFFAYVHDGLAYTSATNPGGEGIPAGWKASADEELERIIRGYIKRRHTTIEKLGTYLGVSARTISRFWTDQNIRPTLDIVVAVCLALHMPPADSMKVVELTGYSLRNIPRERIYHYLLHVCFMQDMRICNELLKYAGCRALPVGEGEL